MPQSPAHLRPWTLTCAVALSLLGATTVGMHVSAAQPPPAPRPGSTAGVPVASPTAPRTVLNTEVTLSDVQGRQSATDAPRSARATSVPKPARPALAPTSSRPQPTHLFFVPHQDDEVLAMGAAIRAAVREGHVVQVILVTDGSFPGAAVVRQVNERLSTAPLSEGPAMTAARDAEFLAATRALGVPSGQVHRVGLRDGALTAERATGVIAEWAARYPHATLTTMSWLDVHPDHYTLGYALDRYCLTQRRSGCRFTQFQRFVQDSTAPSASPVVSPPGTWLQGDAKVYAAAEEYRRWDPRRGRYGIGWLFSVPSQFAHLRTHCRSWIHGTSATWDNVVKRRAAETWARTHQWRRAVADNGTLGARTDVARRG